MFDFCFFKAPWTKSELENLLCQGKYYALMAPSYFQKYRSNIQSEVIAWIVLRLALWICLRCKHDLSVEKGYWCVVVHALAHADAASSPARYSDQRLNTRCDFSPSSGRSGTTRGQKAPVTFIHATRMTEKNNNVEIDCISELPFIFLVWFIYLLLFVIIFHFSQNVAF